MEKINQAVLIAKDEGVPSLVLPTEIHRCGFKMAIPRVQDVLADVVQQSVHRECFHVVCVDQDMVGEQSEFFHSGGTSCHASRYWLRRCWFRFCHMGSSRERERSGAVRT